MNAPGLKMKERFRLSRFVRGEKASPDPVILNHRRIFILPTRRGLGFAFLATLLFFIGFVYNNNPVYLLAFLLAGIFFLSTVHTFRTLAGLVIREGYGKPVFAGDTAAFPIHIDNPTSLLRPQIRIEGQPETELTLPPESRSQIFVHRTAARRGWCEAGPITLCSTFPLGLFRAWSPLRFNMKILVYPQLAEAGVPLPPLSAGPDRDGVGRQGSDEFYGLKNYSAGDPVRRIHWKAYAKGYGVLSKQYRGGGSGELWLDFDETPGGGTEERLSRLCRWVLEADQAGLRYGLRLPGNRIMPADGAQHRQSCLEALALYPL
ncbi:MULTISPECIES: DUF58 domain-containing protein [Methylomicrobium]|uniref:Uncharacterized protein n=1 Tax=Methylomicrobium album BG8 TaxID=686340 RepID=H8GKN8_METAL|nr:MULTISPECIES: DUF58 domain-containing protein [Methylomicrobium]EIC28046.1 hypothetical protein Metal_0179 [Methylomicrobium album BG8]